MNNKKPRGWAYTKEKGFSWIDPETGEIVYGKYLPDWFKEDTELMAQGLGPEFGGVAPEQVGLEEVPSGYLSAGRMWMPPENVEALRRAEWEKWMGETAPSTPGQNFYQQLEDIKVDWKEWWLKNNDIRSQRINAIIDPQAKLLAQEAADVEARLEMQKWMSLIETEEAKFDELNRKLEFSADQLYKAGDMIIGSIRNKMPSELTQPAIPTTVEPPAPGAGITPASLIREKTGWSATMDEFVKRAKTGATFWGRETPSEKYPKESLMLEFENFVKTYGLDIENKPAKATALIRLWEDKLADLEFDWDSSDPEIMNLYKRLFPFMAHYTIGDLLGTVPTVEQFTIGQIHTKEDGTKWKYVGDGKWQEL